MPDDIANRKPRARAKVEHLTAPPCPQPFQPADMCVDQVHDMNIFTDAGGVFSGVIIEADRSG
jgi:hypothetical protein